jgi:hypothetical protein
MPLNPHNNKKSERSFSLFLLLTALEGLAVVLYLLPLAGGPAGSVRLITQAMLAVSMLLSLALLTMAGIFWFRPQERQQWLRLEPQFQGWTRRALLALAVIPLAIITSRILHGLFLGTENFIYRMIFERLDPWLVWACLAAGQLWLWMLWVRKDALRQLWYDSRKTRFVTLTIWCIFLLLALIVRQSGMRVPETSMTTWAVPPAPLLEWHIWLSCLAAALFFVLENRPARPGYSNAGRLRALLRSDRFWFLLIWALSLAIWASQPLLPSHYATAGRPPNFEIYPFSDGAIYDQYAQSILIGNGLMGDDIPARPLYVIFLALLHMLGGQDYQKVILLQTILLAFFPAVIYLLGAEFHSRQAGILAALLTILREVHSFHAAPFTRSVANVKLYFSEIPTALGLSLFLLFTLRWLKNRHQPGAYPLLAGGVLGMTMLIRTQSLIVLPIALLFTFLLIWPQWKKFLAPTALLLLGLLVTITPWLWRNYQITGELIFDNPLSQTGEMARRYAVAFEENPNTIMDRRPDENDGEYTKRLNEYIVKAIAAHPDYAFKTISTHLANSSLTSFLILPVRTTPPESWQALLRSQDAFWEYWPESPPVGVVMLLILNMGLVALGIAAAWQKLGWGGLIPLSMNLMYNLATAIFQVSGMRFVLPVIWIVYFYFALGVLQIFQFVWKFLCPAKQQTTQIVPQSSRPLVWWQAGLVILFFAFTGSSLILAEQVVPPRFPSQNGTQILTELRQFPAVQQSPALQAELERVAENQELLVYKGRGVYPRYYADNEVEPDTAKAAYANLYYARMVFFFLSKQTNQVVALPMASIPDHFPHPLDMILIGCQQELMIEARLVAALDDTQALYLSNLSELSAACESGRKK